MKLYVLVKVYDLVVDGVEAFRTKKQAHTAFQEWTEGLTPSQLARREAKNPEEKYSQIQIFDVDLEAMDGRSSKIGNKNMVRGNKNDR